MGQHNTTQNNNSSKFSGAQQERDSNRSQHPHEGTAKTPKKANEFKYPNESSRNPNLQSTPKNH